MKTNLVRYETKPESADENERLIKAVFEELRAKAPEGLSYQALRLPDGSFVHVATVTTSDGTNPLLALDAFKAFTAGIKERCVVQPHTVAVTVVGDYRR